MNHPSIGAIVITTVSEYFDQHILTIISDSRGGGVFRPSKLITVGLMRVFQMTYKEIKEHCGYAWDYSVTDALKNHQFLMRQHEYNAAFTVLRNTIEDKISNHKTITFV